MHGEMEVLSDIPFELDMEGLLSSVHVANDTDDARDIERLMQAVLPVARPKAAYRVCYVRHRDDEAVAIDGIVFTSRVLRVNLEKVERVFPYVCTCGRELHKADVPPAGGALVGFWLDTIKEMALRAAGSYLKSHLRDEYAIRNLSSMNPGAGAQAMWPIEQQRELFSLLGDVESAVGVRLTDSCLMIPNKSISGICFPTEVTFHACRLCPRERCPGRTAPYDRASAESYTRKSRR